MGDNPAFHAPCFVLSHKAQETIVKQGGTSYTFITDGIESALEKSQAAAGEKDIVLNGGANAAQQYLEAELLDEINFHLVHALQAVRQFVWLQIGFIKVVFSLPVHRSWRTPFAGSLFINQVSHSGCSNVRASDH